MAALNRAKRKIRWPEYRWPVKRGRVGADFLFTPKRQQQTLTLMAELEKMLSPPALPPEPDRGRRE